MFDWQVPCTSEGNVKGPPCKWLGHQWVRHIIARYWHQATPPAARVIEDMGEVSKSVTKGYHVQACDVAKWPHR